MLEPRLFTHADLALIENWLAQQAIDPAVHDVTVYANALGIPTRGCCEGHLRAERPYVACGFDYGDASPDDEASIASRAVNRAARARLERLLADFHQGRKQTVRVRLIIEPGPDAQVMHELRARFTKQRAALLVTEPARVARNFNYRQYEDIFTLRAGDNDRWTWPVGRRLLRRRQDEMRAFGDYLRQRLSATCESPSCSQALGSSPTWAP